VLLLCSYVEKWRAISVNCHARLQLHSCLAAAVVVLLASCYSVIGVNFSTDVTLLQMMFVGIQICYFPQELCILWEIFWLDISWLLDFMPSPNWKIIHGSPGKSWYSGNPGFWVVTCCTLPVLTYRVSCVRRRPIYYSWDMSVLLILY